MARLINSKGQFATTHGLSNTPTYNSWSSMWARCTRPAMDNYDRYGGRGIKVCKRWKKFSTFLADMGERPEGMTLDRVNPNGDYKPSNCKWATVGEQARNRRNTRLNTDIIAKARKLRSDGMGFQAIGRLLGVQRTTIRAALVGLSWQ
jgi:hypothetical protein